MFVSHKTQKPQGKLYISASWIIYVCITQAVQGNITLDVYLLRNSTVGNQ